MKLRVSNPLRPHLLTLAALLATPLVHAADGTWNGISGNWSDTTDPGGIWSGGTFADLIDSTANFTGADITADQILTLDTPRTVGNITFTDATTSSNNLTISGANILTLDRTTGAPLIDVTQSDRTLTISSVVAGNDGLQKNGLGTLTLSGANTYTGTTTISSGELRLSGSAFTTTPGRTYQINTGAVMSFGTSGSIADGANTTIQGTGTLRVLNGVVISGGTGTRKINMNLGAGALIDVQVGGSFGLGYQPIVWTNNKASLNMNGNHNMWDDNAIIADALTGSGSIGCSFAGGSTSLTIGTANGSGTFSGTITHGLGGGTRSIALIKSGTGTQTLSGANSYTGTTTISNGILAISSNTALGASSSNTTIAATGLSAGPSLAISGNINSAENFSLTGNTEQNQYNAAISNSSGVNTLSGNITLSSPSGNIRISSYGGELILAGAVSQTGTTRTLVLQASTGAALTVNNAIANNNAPLSIISYFGGAPSNGVTLKAASTTIGATSVAEKGLLKLGVTDALKTNANLTIGAAGNFSGNGGFDYGTFDLAGFNQTVNALVGTKNSGNTIGADSNRIVTNSAASTTSLLTVGNGNATGTFNGVILDGAGAVALTKADSGAQTLVGVNTYSGNTTVSGGTLTLNNPNANNQSSTVSIAASGATLNLTYAGTDTVDKLFIGATQLAAGVYGNSSSVLPIIARSEITGTGTLTVTTGPGGSTYTAWQSANSTTQTINQDHDNDGVSNGVEYFLFGPVATSGFTPLPGVINNAGTLSVTWTKAAGYTGVYGTDFFVETSATLVGAWTTETASPTPGFTVTFPTANEVKYTFPAGTKNFARLKVTGP